MSERRDTKRLLGFLAAVFLIKLIVVWQLYDHPLLQPDAGLDTSAYVALAERVRRGDVLLGPGLYFVSPLYIYVLAGALTLFGTFTAVRVLQVALGTIAVGFVFVAADEWFGRRAAWIAAVAAALTGLFTFYEALLLQSALDPFLTAASLAALALGLSSTSRDASNAAERPLRAWFVLAGIALGLEILNRPNAVVPAAVVLALLFAIRRLRSAALVAAGLAVALAPVAARNAAVAGTWSPMPSHGGLNFYIGNNSEADGTYHAIPGITPDIGGQQVDARRVVSEALGHPVNDQEASAYFVRKALGWMRTQPFAAIRLFLRKLTYTFNAAHIPLNDSYPFYAHDLHTLLAVLFVGAWILVPLGVTGLVVCAPRDRVPSYVVWASFVPAYAVGVAIFFVSDRYRVPLLIPLCVGAGAVIDRSWAAFEARRDPRWMAALCGVLVVFANWPLGLDDGRAEERTRMAEEEAVEGRADLAEAWVSKAEQGNPEPALVEFRVGRALIAHHDLEAGIRHLARARELDPGRAETEYALGEALLDAGRPRDAVPHLRQAVSKGVRVDVARFDLARALAATGDRSGAIEALGGTTPANPRDAASWIALGDLAVSLDARELEQRFFSEAVSADRSNATAHLNLAVVLAQEGRVAEARTHAQEALKLKPDYDKARQLLAALSAERR